jgi:hypothetical protein
MCGPRKVPGVYIHFQRSTGLPLRVGESSGVYGRVRNHVVNVDGLCRQHNIRPDDLGVIVLPLIDCPEARKMIELLLQQGFGLRDGEIGGPN